MGSVILIYQWFTDKESMGRTSFDSFLWNEPKAEHITGKWRVLVWNGGDFSHSMTYCGFNLDCPGLCPFSSFKFYFIFFHRKLCKVWMKFLCNFLRLNYVILFIVCMLELIFIENLSNLRFCLKMEKMPFCAFNLKMHLKRTLGYLCSLSSVEFI